MRPLSCVLEQWRTDWYSNKDGAAEAYNAIEKQIREAHPEIADRREVESIAQAQLYKENEGKQWFKIVTK